MKRNRLFTIFKKDDGAAVVETAIVLPILITVIAFVFEMGMYILLHSKLTRMAGVLTDTITRQNLSSSTLRGLLNTADTITFPFDFTRNGKIVVSQVRNSRQSNNAADMRISWQENKGGGVSLIGQPGMTPQNLPNNIIVIQDQTIVVTEVFYQYTPLVFRDIFSVQSIYKTAVFVPRTGDMNALLSN